MQTLIFESILIGTITSILGNLILKILLKFNSVDDNNSLEHLLNKYKDTYIIQTSLFFTGILIHLLLEYIGLEKWHCQKVCLKDRCKIVCEKNI